MLGYVSYVMNDLRPAVREVEIIIFTSVPTSISQAFHFILLKFVSLLVAWFTFLAFPFQLPYPQHRTLPVSLPRSAQLEFQLQGIQWSIQVQQQMLSSLLR